MIKLSSISLFLLLLFCRTAPAQIQWEQRELEFRPGLQETNVIAHFKFKNMGAQPVTIASVKTSCGCTTAKLEKQLYASGETGEIQATFSFGERMGLQQKEILVQNDQPKDPLTVLTMKIWIPEFLKITPTMLSWQKNEEPKPKSISIQAQQETSVQITRIVPNNDNVKFELVTVQAGKEYELRITPANTNQNSWSALQIETDFPKEHPRKFTVYAQVR